MNTIQIIPSRVNKERLSIWFKGREITTDFSFYTLNSWEYRNRESLFGSLKVDSSIEIISLEDTEFKSLFTENFIVMEVFFLGNDFISSVMFKHY